MVEQHIDVVVIVQDILPPRETAFLQACLAILDTCNDTDVVCRDGFHTCDGQRCRIGSAFRQRATHARCFGQVAIDDIVLVFLYTEISTPFTAVVPDKLLFWGSVIFWQEHINTHFCTRFHGVGTITCWGGTMAGGRFHIAGSIWHQMNHMKGATSSNPLCSGIVRGTSGQQHCCHRQ